MTASRESLHFGQDVLMWKVRENQRSTSAELDEKSPGKVDSATSSIMHHEKETTKQLGIDASSTSGNVLDYGTFSKVYLKEGNQDLELNLKRNMTSYLNSLVHDHSFLQVDFLDRTIRCLESTSFTNYSYSILSWMGKIVILIGTNVQSDSYYIDEENIFIREGFGAYCFSLAKEEPLSSMPKGQGYSIMIPTRRPDLVGLTNPLSITPYQKFYRVLVEASAANPEVIASCFFVTDGYGVKADSIFFTFDRKLVCTNYYECELALYSFNPKSKKYNLLNKYEIATRVEDREVNLTFPIGDCSIGIFGQNRESKSVVNAFLDIITPTNENRSALRVQTVELSKDIKWNYHWHWRWLPVANIKKGVLLGDQGYGYIIDITKPTAVTKKFFFPYKNFLLKHFSCNTLASGQLLLSINERCRLDFYQVIFSLPKIFQNNLIPKMINEVIKNNDLSRIVLEYLGQALYIPSLEHRCAHYLGGLWNVMKERENTLKARKGEGQKAKGEEIGRVRGEYENKYRLFSQKEAYEHVCGELDNTNSELTQTLNMPSSGWSQSSKSFKLVQKKRAEQNQEEAVWQSLIPFNRYV